MATPIRLKRSAVTGKRPVLDDLQIGELALNFYDGYLWAKRDTNGVGIGTTIALLTPWTETFGGQSIYYNKPVGIGTTNPTSKLHIFGDVNINSLAKFNPGGSVELYFNGSKKFETTGIGFSIFNGASSTATISGPDQIVIDPSAVGDNTGSVRIKGDLFVDGTQTIINSQIIELTDFNVGFATDIGENVFLDGAGIGIGSQSIRKTFTYDYSSDSLKSSENFDLFPNKSYKINEVERLSFNLLTVPNFNVSGLGTVGNLNVTGFSTFTGLLDANGGATIDNIRIGVAGDNEIDTSSGFLILDSFAGVVFVDDSIQVSGNNTLSFNSGSLSIVHESGNGSITNSVGNLILGSSENGSIVLGRGSSTFARFTHNGASELYYGGLKKFETLGAGATVTGTLFTNQLSVSGISTFVNLLDANGGATIDNIQIGLNGDNVIDTSVGTLTIDSSAGNVIVDDRLRVSGLSTFQSNVDIQGSLTVNGVNIAGGASIGEDIVTRHLQATGLSTFTGRVDANNGALVSGIATIQSLEIISSFDSYVSDSRFHGDVTIDGNVNVAGTSFNINVETFKILDNNLILGFTTTQEPNDTTANYGGVAIASTEGNPIVDISVSGIDSIGSNYKQLLWVKGGTFGVGTTDAWLFNYAVGVGSTQIPNGVRFAVKETQFTDNTINTPNINVSKNLNVTGFSTFTGLLDANGGATIDNIRIGVAGNNEIDTSTGNLTIDSAGGTVTIDDRLNVVGISTFSNRVIFNSTNSIQIPVGTTAQRDSVGTAVTGQIRYNSEYSTFEGYGPGGQWGSLGGVKDVDGNTYIIPESSPGANENTLYFYNNGSETVRINEIGFVGIGSTQPTSKLSVVGDARITGVITASTRLSTGASGVGINITQNTISGPSELIIDPAGVGDNTGSLRIKGDLYVDGTQTVINSSTIELGDFNVGIATTVGTNLLLDGAGIGIGSTTIRKTITWENSSSSLKSSENWKLPDNKKILLGNDNELQLYHDGSNSFIQNTGALYLDVSAIALYRSPVHIFTNGAGTETLAYFTQNAGIELFYNDSKKFETIGAGATVSGTLFANQLNVSGITTLTTFNVIDGNIVTGIVTNLRTTGISSISVGVITDAYITTGIVTNLSTSGIGTINTASIDLAYVKTGIVTNLSASGIGTIATASVDLAYVKTGIVTNLSTSGIGTINTSSIDLAYVKTGIVTNLSTSGIGTIATVSVDLAYVKTGIVTNLSTSGIGTIATASVDLAYVKTGIVTNLTTTGIGTINTASVDLAYVKTGIVTNLSTTGIASITTGIVTNLSASGIGTIATASVDLAYVKTGIVTNLSTSGIGTINTASIDLAYVKTGIVTNLTTSGIGTIATASVDLAYVKTGIVTNLSTSGIGTIRTASIDLAYVKSGIVTNLTTSGIGTIRTASVDLAYVKTGIVTNLSTSGIGSITTLNATTGNIVTGLVTTISGTTATYTTGNITTGIVTNLTTSGIGSITTLNATTGNIVTGLVTTISGTTATYTTGNITTGIVTNLTTSGIGTIATASVDLAYVKTGIVTNLTTTGIGTIATSSVDLAYVKTGIVTNLSTSGIGTINTASIDLAYVNTGIVTNLSGTNLYYTGIATFGNIQINTSTNNRKITTINNQPLTIEASSGTIFLDSDVTITGNTSASNIYSSGIVTASTRLSTGASGVGINITQNTISGPSELIIDPAGVGDNTGAVRIKGDLYVDGTQTVINSSTIELADFNVGIATTVGTNSLLDGAGIGIGSTGIRKTLTWDNSNLALKSSENFNLASGKVYEIDGTTILSSTNLFISNINSSGISTINTASIDLAYVKTGIVTNLTTSGIGTIATASVDLAYVKTGIVTNLTTSGIGTINTASVDLAYVKTGIVTNLSTSGIGTINTASIDLAYVKTGIVTNLSTSGIGTIRTASVDLAYVKSGIVTNLSTSGIGTIRTASIDLAYVKSGIVTNLSTSGIGTIATASVDLAYVNTGIVTNLRTTGIASITTGIVTNLSVSGFSTFSNNINALDNVRLDFGNNKDFYLIRYGSPNPDNAFIQANALTLNVQGGNGTKILDDGANTVADFHVAANSARLLFTGTGSGVKLQTLGAGVTVTGTLFTDQLSVSGITTLNTFNVIDGNIVTGIVTNLTTSGIGTINTASIDLAYVKTGIVTNLSTSGIGTINTASVDLAYVKTGIVTNLTTTGIASVATGIVTNLSTSGIGTIRTASIDLAYVKTGIVTNLSTSGIGTIRTASVDLAYVKSGIVTNLTTTGIASVATGIVTNLSTSGIGTIRTASIDLAYVKTGIVTNLSTSGIGTINTASIDLAYVKTGIVTSLTSTNATLTNIDSAGITTLGIVTATQLYVSGVTTTNNLTVNSTSLFQGGIQADSIIFANGGIQGDLTGNISGNINSAGVSTFNSANITSLAVSGISTFTNGPVLIGAATSTGTASQRLQVTGGGYFSGSVGIGTTNPTTKLFLDGAIGFVNSNIRIGSDQTLPSATGSSNIAIGNFAGNPTSSGTRNVFIGEFANAFGSDGSYNVMVGYRGSSQGSHNIHIGEYHAGGSGNYNVVIGSGDAANNYNFGVQDPSKDLQFAIGVNTTSNNPTDSQYWLVGNEQFNIGIGTVNPISKLHVVGDAIVTGVITASTRLSTGASGVGINITQNTISGPSELIIDPAGVGDNTGAVRIKGDLFIDGTQTFINSSTIELADFNVGIATTVGTNSLLDGAGIGIGSTGIRKTLTWDNSSSSLKSSENFNLSSGKVYKINGTEVLSASQLTVANINASGITSTTNLTTQQLNVSGVSTFVGNANFQSDVLLGNGDKVIFGDSNNFQVYHSGTEAWVSNGIGDLHLRTDLGQSIILQDGSSDSLAVFNSNGSVELYYNNVKEFETLGAGVTVTGTTFTNQLSVSGVGTINTASVDLAYVKTGITTNLITTGIATIATGIVTNLTTSGIGSITTLNATTGNIVTGLVTTLSGSTATYTTGNLGTLNATTGNIVTGLVTTISGTTATYTTGNFGTANITNGNIVTGIVTTLSGTTATYTNLNTTYDSQGSATATTATTSQTAIHSTLSATTYRSVEYLIQATEGTNFHITKILAIHDGSIVYLTEYGSQYNNSSVATYDIDLSGGNIRLLATPASSSSTTFKISFTTIVV